MILLLGLLAFGEDNLPELWAQLHEGQLVHLVDGSPQEAIEIFQALLKGLSSDHPLFGDLIFSLGRAQYDVGKVELAKKSIYSALHVPNPPKGSIEYYLHLLAEENIIQGSSYFGNPWVCVAKNETWDYYYAVRLGENLQKRDVFHVDLESMNRVEIVLVVYGKKGTKYTQEYSLEIGKHRISITKAILPKTIQKEGVFLLELREKNRASIHPFLLSIP